MTDTVSEIKNRCCHPGCESIDTTECFLPDNQSEIPDEYYCTEHSQSHGYCYLCGQFWGGVESFEFASTFDGIQGLCENCSEALRLELDGDDDEIDYDFMNDNYY